MCVCVCVCVCVCENKKYVRVSWLVLSVLGDLGENDELSAFNSQLKIPIRDLKASVIALQETFFLYNHKVEISENQLKVYS